MNTKPHSHQHTDKNMDEDNHSKPQCRNILRHSRVLGNEKKVKWCDDDEKECKCVKLNIVHMMRNSEA